MRGEGVVVGLVARRVAELGQQPGAVLRHEGRERVVGELTLVGGEHRPRHPGDDVVGPGEGHAVDAQRDVELPQPGRPQQLGVARRRLDPGRFVARCEAELAAEGVGDAMAGVVEVGRHLEGELTARSQEADELGEEVGVVGDPLVGGVREHQVEALGAVVERADEFDVGQVALDEPEARRRGRRGGDAEHACGAVDPDGLGGADPLVESGGDLPRAAAQVDHPTAGHRIEEGEQVVGRAGALVVELLVDRRVPGVELCHRQREYKNNTSCEWVARRDVGARVRAPLSSCLVRIAARWRATADRQAHRPAPSACVRHR